jgi:hypothetical protein
VNRQDTGKREREKKGREKEKKKKGQEFSPVATIAV